MAATKNTALRNVSQRSSAPVRECAVSLEAERLYGFAAAQGVSDG